MDNKFDSNNNYSNINCNKQKTVSLPEVQRCGRLFG